MFFPLPMHVDHIRNSKVRPVANTWLVCINVLVYLLLDPVRWSVGRGANPLCVLTYGFLHTNIWHLILNMWFLWVIGNAVNRRIGDGYYFLAYVGTIVFLGLWAWLLSPYALVGSSGAVFAIMAIAALLLPGARVRIHYLALFPLTVLMGLLRRPEYGLFWIIRWGSTQLAMIGLVLGFVVLESCGIVYWGPSWTSLGHLMGLVCGVGIVLMMPTQVTMGSAARSV